jgi:GT2 family glycosyltransferase
MRPVSPTRHDAVVLGELDLDAPLPPLGAASQGREARLLARVHTRPLGELRIAVPAGGLTPAEVADVAWESLSDRVAAHLAEDGQPVPDRLGPEGLPHSEGRPACLAGRDRELPRITVVIATRDRTRSLVETLSSLAGSDYGDFDVLVVDSAPSSPDTRQAVHAGAPWPFPLRYVATSTPGLGFAHNLALACGTEEIVAFTDDDVQVDRYWLAAIGAAFGDPEVGCVTGLILPTELETPAQFWLEQSGGFSRGYERRRFSLRHPAPEPTFPFAAGRFGSGANMAFRASWLRGAGGFDPATGAGSPARGGDDLQAFLRVILDGAALVYEPAAIIRHAHRREYDGLRRQAFGYGRGLGAYLTAALWARPALLGPMLRRSGPAMRHLLAADSVKNRGKEPDFPSELTWLERAGLLTGPFAYAVSRWRYRRLGPQAPAQAISVDARQPARALAGGTWLR